MKKSILGAAAVLTLFLLLCNPILSFEGARGGLLLWSQTVLPTLLPFMICSNVIVALDAIDLLTWPFRPFLTRVLKLSPAGCYILVSGLLCGYPMGAKTCSEFLDGRRITRKEASYLLSICNHPSPMFLLGYVAGSMTGSSPIPLLISLYLPVLPLSILSRRLYGVKTVCQGAAPGPNQSLSFDRTMMGSVEVMVKIGGYIMVFSILARFMQDILGPSGTFQSLILGIVEITTGIQALSHSSTGTVQALAVIGITAFGGFSGIVQTGSVLSAPSKKAGLSIRHYLMWKLLHGFLACVIFILLSSVLPILC